MNQLNVPLSSAATRPVSILLLRILLFILSGSVLTNASGQSIDMKITHQFLNIPLGHQDRLKLVELKVNGKMKREFPVQLALDSIDYWTYIDVSELKGQMVRLECPAPSSALRRIYQADTINGSDSLYKETNRPQFHFTVKRGWSNDINGPVFLNGQYHLFWQAFPFGLLWNTGFMYWGHAVSKDMLHWEELAPALMLDSLGSPWSGTAVIDHNNNAGFGKGALVLFYTAFDRVSNKQVQCIAYSLDNGKTFQRYKGNPVIDSNWEMQTTHTRDPKVFWYEPAKHWVMVLFEKDGMSFYNSTDLRQWKKQSHFAGLHECPDFFELPVEGNTNNKKWVLHGGSSEYFIGAFDGKQFIPESDRLSYAQGQTGNKTEIKGDILYAAESFENMPDNRRVQIAWGRVYHDDMPFTQMMLFPTEFVLKNTPDGLRLQAKPIREIEQLHKNTRTWNDLTATTANRQFDSLKAMPAHLRMNLSIECGNTLQLMYQGNELLALHADKERGDTMSIEILVDKTVAEIFINDGQQYIIRQLKPKRNDRSFEFNTERYGPAIQKMQWSEMKSIWKQ
ncbi:MAG: glycoside hydrolase family 32 protein [Chitinophagaceae bacterium]|nr:glycoside hydrolase family 32 protein [Chitinophagaceae bacterium]